MTSPKGFPIEGKRDENDVPTSKLESKFSTVVPKGVNRRALDVIEGGFFEVNAAVVVEALSTDSLVIVTGHSVKKGDLFRLMTSTNTIQEFEMFVDEVIDANSFRLAGVLSADLTAGDTFDQLRYVSKKMAADGSELSSVTVPPIQFVLDSVVTTVNEDTVTPANNAPLPVKITSATGDINITAGDLNVQTSHVGASHDSMRIGNGTNLMAVNASLEAQVRDDDANTALTSIDGKDFATQVTLAALLVELALKADLTETQPVSMASSPLPTGAATEVTAAAILADLALKADLTETQPVSAASLPLPTGASTATNQGTVITALANLLTELQLKADLAETQPVSAASLPLPTGAATEATLAAQSAKLPATLGPAAEADSLSVTMASDTTMPGSAFDMLAFAQLDMDASNVTNAAYVELISTIGATEGRKIQLAMTAGDYMLLAVGAAASEVDVCIIPKGGFADGHLEITIPANSRLSVKRLVAGTTSAGEITINIMG